MLILAKNDSEPESWPEDVEVDFSSTRRILDFASIQAPLSFISKSRSKVDSRGLALSWPERL